ncbi:hypothetical protein E2562_011920 [Oryza meyeriana var. granulata]|uniref:Uncharacterized protein n=1 Tax=Oryza meyeriana var. granulata TaxID=110450 RepID=A0A6G1CFN8_9ORYZ|nr:hypothetical protein E2562_011920 [Oryza meyeriana var. granulata]
MKVSEIGVSTSSSSAGQNEDPNQVIVSGVGGDTRNQEEGQHTLSTEEILALDDDDPEKEEVAGSTGKRKKREVPQQSMGFSLVCTMAAKGIYICTWSCSSKPARLRPLLPLQEESSAPRSATDPLAPNKGEENDALPQLAS